MGPIEITVIVLVAAFAAGMAIAMIVRKLKGKPPMSSDCGCCPHSGACHDGCCCCDEENAKIIEEIKNRRQASAQDVSSDDVQDISSDDEQGISFNGARNTSADSQDGIPEDAQPEKGGEEAPAVTDSEQSPTADDENPTAGGENPHDGQ